MSHGAPSEAPEGRALPPIVTGIAMTHLIPCVQKPHRLNVCGQRRMSNHPLMPTRRGDVLMALLSALSSFSDLRCSWLAAACFSFIGSELG
jgi:hypothetical protein